MNPDLFLCWAMVGIPGVSYIGPLNPGLFLYSDYDWGYGCIKKVR